MKPGILVYVLICGILGVIDQTLGITIRDWHFWAYFSCVFGAYVCGTTVRR